MPGKHPAWTRARVGRDRVRWVAYDDRVDSPDRQVVAEGYAPTLAGADAAARAALAALGIFQGRRMSATARPALADKGLDAPRQPAKFAGRDRSTPRRYLYTRRSGDEGEPPLVVAHLIVKQTPRRVHVTLKACGPDQIGTEDEIWEPAGPTVAVDRAILERDGSAYSKGQRHSDYFRTREAAEGDGPMPGPRAFRALGLRSPCTVEDIKAAYRRKALEVHPDRGGDPGEFRAVEAAYRRLLREAEASGP